MRQRNLEVVGIGSGDTPGRKEGGQEQVVKPEAVKDRIEHLVKLYREADDAKTELSEAVKKVAEKAGIKASVLKSFVAARAGEDFEKARAKSAQLELLFEEVGE